MTITITSLLLNTCLALSMNCDHITADYKDLGSKVASEASLYVGGNVHIGINTNLSPAKTHEALVHELAHAKLFEAKHYGHGRKFEKECIKMAKTAGLKGLKAKNACKAH